MGDRINKYGAVMNDVMLGRKEIRSHLLLGQEWKARSAADLVLAVVDFRQCLPGLTVVRATKENFRAHENYATLFIPGANRP